MLSDIDLPSPKLAIPKNYIPRFLKSRHADRPPEPAPDESGFSFSRIGGLDAPGFRHPAPTTPKFHVRRGTPSRSREHARLMTQSWSVDYKFPNQSIPFSRKYFGEAENIIGCFTEIVPVTVPEDFRGSATTVKVKATTERNPLPGLRSAHSAMPRKASPPSTGGKAKGKVSSG
jgi:hypothetical protein